MITEQNKKAVLRFNEEF